MAKPSILKIEKLQTGSLICEVAMSSNVGLQRTENQDSFGFAQSANSNLFVVADGMGGARGGGTASAMAVNLIVNKAFDNEGKVEETALVNAISLSNQVIFTRSKLEPHLHGMGTTVVAVVVDKEKVLVAHVGDSRVYFLRDRKLKQVTRDHTLVQELIDNGALDPANAESYPISHMLTRSLGPLENVKIDISVMPHPQAGDKFLLCSDGLYNHLGNQELEDILNTSFGKSAIIELEHLALDDGGSDNLTIQLIEFKESAAETVPEKNLNGSSEKYIFSEMNISEIQGYSFNDYVEKVLSGQPMEHVEVHHDNFEDNLSSIEQINPPESVQDVNTKEFIQTLTPEKSTKRSYSQLFLGVSLILLVAVISVTLKKEFHEKPALKEKDISRTPVTTAGVTTIDTVPVVPQDEDLAEKQLEERKELIASLEKDLKNEESQPLKKETELLIDDEIFANEEKPLDPEVQKIIAEQVAWASDYFVSESPIISLGNSSSSEPNQPVDWKEEKNLMKIISSSIKKEEIQTQELPQLRTIEENKELALKKQELRNKIFDVDLKIAMLFFENEKEARFKSNRLLGDIKGADTVIDLLETQLDNEKEKLKRWQFFVKKLEQQTPLRLADSLYHLSPEVRQKRKAYSELTENYLQAVETWQNNPKDAQAASYMNLMSKEIKTKKVELENEVRNAIQNGLLEAEERIKKIKFNLSNIETRKDQLYHHIGFLKVFAVTPKGKKREYQNRLLDQRKSFFQELKNLRNGFSDNEEISFRLANADLFYQK